jgi:hypothetical protein
MRGHTMLRRRALLGFALAVSDPTANPDDVQAAAIHALETAFAAELGLNLASVEEIRLTGLMEKFKTAFQPAQTELFEGTP